MKSLAGLIVKDDDGILPDYIRIELWNMWADENGAFIVGNQLISSVIDIVEMNGAIDTITERE